MNKKWITSLLLAALCIGLSSCFDEPNEDPNDIEVKQIDAYLAASLTSDLILYDNSTGMRFVFQEFGNEPPPHIGQTVKANYTGRLFSNGTVFETGTIDKKLEDIPIQCIKYAIASLLKGASMTLYVPSKYGYGSTGANNVPPNAILIYTIELTDVIRTASEDQRFAIDTAAIHTYLKNNSINNAIYHPSGLWYTVGTLGTGIYPAPYDNVTFDYKLKVLSNGNTIQESTITGLSVFGLIDGMKCGLPLIAKGGTATFYIPSGLGYGPTGTQDIPPNTNLIFEVSLTEVLR